MIYSQIIRRGYKVHVQNRVVLVIKYSIKDRVKTNMGGVGT